MELNLISTADGSISGSVSVESQIFDAKYNETLIHQLVTAYQAGGRAGTKAQKRRSDVSGGGAKPWRQKGTGRARAGTSRSPIWRKGGVTFAARPRDYTQKINKKMYRAGIRSILSQLFREERISAINEITITEARTKLLNASIKHIKSAGTLVITENDDKAIQLASQNIPNFEIINSRSINPVKLIRSKKVFLTEASIRQLEESLK